MNGGGKERENKSFINLIINKEKIQLMIKKVMMN